MSVIEEVSGRVVPVVVDDLDTDRIIPARFLRCVTFDGLGEHAFADERRDGEGKSLNHPIDDPRFAGASVLLAGKNFGCGSSREHAPQALVRAGFKAVIAESFAEIFAGNALTLGLVCVEANEDQISKLAGEIESDATQELKVDVKEETITIGENVSKVTVPAVAKDALLGGRWDPLNELISNKEKVSECSKQLPYMAWGS